MDALIALLGVVVGGLLTYLLTFRVEQAKWKREDKFRWAQEKEAAYAKLITAATNTHSLLCGLAVIKGLKQAEGTVKLTEISAFSRRNPTALERRINNLETVMKRS